MPRKPKKECVSAQYFRWLVGTRNGVYFADGRSNNPNIGRHSLGTRDRQKALQRLHRLDLVKAVELGRADPALLKESQDNLLTLEDGCKRYLEFASRPLVQGGVSAGSVKRYRSVLDKFTAFVRQKRVAYWQQVNKELLMSYGRWLEDEDYGYATQYLELTTIKQVVKWMVGASLLPASSIIAFQLKKAQGTTTYCYTRTQVLAIVMLCRRHTDLSWMGNIVVALATTGLRIGELASLRWADVDFERGLLRLTDTTRQVRRSRRQQARTTKSHRNRTLPIHSNLLPILTNLSRHQDGRVFHGPKGGKLKPDTVRNVLMRDVLPQLAESFPAKGDDPGIMGGRLHSFRHFFCSLSADNNVPEQMLMSWLGHRESKMIRHYYHLQQEESRKQMGKIPFLDEAPDVAGNE